MFLGASCAPSAGDDREHSRAPGLKGAPCAQEHCSLCCVNTHFLKDFTIGIGSMLLLNSPGASTGTLTLLCLEFFHSHYTCAHVYRQHTPVHVNTCYLNIVKALTV